MSDSPWLKRIIVGLVIGLVVIVAIVLSGSRLFESEMDARLQTVSDLLAAERFEDAGPIAWQLMRESPTREEVTVLAARAGARLKRSQPSYHRQPCDPAPPSDAPLERIYDHADRLLDAGRIREAEQSLRDVLARDAHHHDANHNLAMLLRFENRFHEAQPYVLELYRQGSFRREYLMTTGTRENRGLLMGGDDFYFDLCRGGVPNDPLPMLHRVSIEQFIADPKPALKILDAVLARKPDSLEAQARRGWLLRTSGADDEFLAWNRSLSRAADEHPLVWVARGLFAQSHDDSRGAVHCLLQAVELDPCDRQAFYHLAQLFRDLSATSQAEVCARRANLLERFESVLGAPPTTLEQIREAVEVAESLQRMWEALGWATEAVRLFPNDQQSQAAVDRLRSEVTAAMPLCAKVSIAGRHLQPSEYPPPDWNSFTTRTLPQNAVSSRSTATRFADRAKALGLNFVFHNGADPSSGTAYMFELSGGGVGVLDFDGDDWPDLYLTQGCEWPVDQQRTKHLDRLFRNVGGERFEDVTSRAGLAENGLSQSASVGDINADGFQDVYVGNVGANRLWLNNGDGTFGDATESAGVAGEDWTASAAFGDLNGDGLQDLYVVNYLSGPDVFTRKCSHPGAGRLPVQCSPTFFPAAQDRLYQNLGDGRFADVTNESGIVAPNGKGLAVVLADFEGHRRLNAFVANDTTANFYFVNHGEHPGGPLRFVDQGVQTGLAYDGNGTAQSSMGVAVGDANDDGTLDLLVTNFTKEVNSLYLHRQADSFVDSIRESGMAEAGFPMMGWGAQFLDGDLDGLNDLFVANGDLYPTSNPYQMPQHYFHNRGKGRFALAASESLGPYFTQRWLGRSVARLDFNRDGLADLAVTHVETPFALLVNESLRHGRFLKVKLRGTVSDREAIGATVRVTAKEKTWTRQLVGGDGFAVSNERELIFGLGDAEQIDSITVAWPAGSDEVFQGVVLADSELLLVEGSQRIVFLRRSP